MRSRIEVWLDRAASILDRSSTIDRAGVKIGGTILFSLMLLTFAAVLLRYVFKRPLMGVAEITGSLMVVVIFLGIAYVQSHTSHIGIDVLVQRLAPKHQVIIRNVTCSLNLGIIFLLIYYSIRYALTMKEAGSSIAIVGIPTYPFVIGIAIGSILLWLLLLRDWLNNLAEGVRLHLGTRLWLLSSGILAVVVIMIILWVQPTLWQMSPITVGLIGFAAMFLLLFTGMYIGSVLLLVTFTFMAHMHGLSFAPVFFGGYPYRILGDNIWTVIALFVLMGFFVFHARLGRDLFEAAYKWLGSLSGGLAAATIGAATALAAVIGDTMSSTLTMGAIALPEMRRYKYDEGIATGTIAAGATIGPMIPPSVNFILYGLITEQPIGTLFISGVFPGLLLSSAFLTYVYIKCRRNPILGPRGASATPKERIGSLKYTSPIVVLFLVVIGGIYAGVFTATEGGGIGAAGAFVIGLAMKRLNWQKFTNALSDATNVIGMMFFIIFPAVMFGHFITASRIPLAVESVISGLNVPPVIIIIAIIAIFLILGCFMDAAAIILISVPIFFPIILRLGYDPIWFGVIVVLMTNLGMITPPFGMICFGLKGVAPDISLNTIFRGVAPFVLVTLIVCGLLIAFPQIATWLPSLLK